MRLLADRCIGATAVHGLRADGHDVLSLVEEGLNPPDAQILTIAMAQHRIVLTEDADFGAHLFRDGLPSAGVIRVEQESPADQLAVFREILMEHGEALGSGAIVTSRRGRIRVAYVAAPR